MNIEEALSFARHELAGTDSPEVDSQVLLCHCLSCETTFLHTWPDKELSPVQQRNFEQLIAQRLQGQPVAHLTGQRGFWSLDLKVTVDTLIPRPDTELLVSLALEKVTDHMLVADLGTGSGAIALSLAIETPTASILATDYSLSALKVAQENAHRYELTNVHFWQGSWLSAITDNSVDMVVSNPPYIEEDDPHLTQGDVRFEPMSALSSGKDGLDDIRHIIEQAKRCLKSQGWLMIEHGYHQAKQVQQLFRHADFTNVSSEQDFGGNDRVVIGQIK